MLINVAVWGRVSDGRGIEYVAAMEAKLLELGGRKMLYSQTNMTSDDLYRHHVNGIAYELLRQQYDPNNIFPQLHEKLQLNASHKRDWTYWLARFML